MATQEENEQDLTWVRKQHQRVETELATVVQKYDALKQEHTALEADATMRIGQLEADIERLKAGLKDAEKTAKERDELKERLAACNQKNQTLQAQNIKLRAGVTSVVDTLSNAFGKVSPLLNEMV